MNPVSVVRIRTSIWHDSRGVVYIEKQIVPLKRMSTAEVHLFAEEVLQIGAGEAVAKISNLDALPDGVYRVEVCNVSKDWETGHVDDWDLRLDKHEPQAQA